MPITGETRLAVVIGSPIRHSLSPTIYNAAFAACGLDWAFVALEVAEREASHALTGMRAFGIEGMSVTMPHKADVARAVDRMTDDARVLNAVNCVVRGADGLLTGHNTDGVGFLDTLRMDHHVDPMGWRVVVIGAGGAARSVVAALTEAGAGEVIVVNRDRMRARNAADLAGSIGRVGDPSEVAGADLVVNATPVGMMGLREPLPVDHDLLHPGQVVVDLVYSPRRTRLLYEAEVRGAQVVEGIGMLVHQAAHQFRLWTGREPPVAVMRAAAEHAVDD
jgi:shikimate dehydrogenase